MCDHFGWTHIANENDLAGPTTRLANESTLTRLRRPRGCVGTACLQLGWLPHDLFPRFTTAAGWPAIQSTAAIHHLVGDGALGKGYESPAGTKPFRGHRQRLDRYDDVDFADYTKAMREMGLWLVDASPAYVSPHVF